MKKITRSAAVAVSILVLPACQPPVSRWVELQNRTGETVTVKWLGDVSHGRQVPAGESARIPVVSGGCLRMGAEDVLVADTAGGRRFTFGPPACDGGTWTLPTR
ncbi:hypothetical protein GCM10009733_017540 [Nonomuraea maheshkhaliensis]|uniref:Uncharacterized protein n=1 Tax=Nonomuraea maheshkhaliensis TaxID=419590 RepID=A0ABN2EYS5_9ACTN